MITSVGVRQIEEMGAVPQVKDQEIMLEQVAAKGRAVAALPMRSKKKTEFPRMLKQHLQRTHSHQSRVFCGHR